jgi:hypothetical protein
MYVNGKFYKTISRTQRSAASPDNLSTFWDFDIQGLAQEVMRPARVVIGSNKVQAAPTVFALLKCKFRSSSIDAEGFVALEDAEPVEGTINADPVEGGGFSSNLFYGLNTALQEENRANLAAELLHEAAGFFAAGVVPLTRRPKKYYLSRRASDYFPIFDNDPARCAASIRIKYRWIGQSTVRESTASIQYSTLDAAVYDVTTVQVGLTVTVGWSVIGSPTAFLVSMDGGPAITTTQTSYIYASLSVGNHTVVVTPVSGCAQGLSASANFNRIDPDAACGAEIIPPVEINQTATGTISVNLPILDPAATSYRIAIDSGPQTTYTVFPVVISAISPGNHSITITPYCGTNAGTPYTQGFVISSAPSITQIYNVTNGPGMTRTQIFKVGASVGTGNRFEVICYGVTLTTVAIVSDTPATIATKIRNAINARTEAQWNAYFGAPPPGTNGFKPVAIANVDEVVIVLNDSNQFSANAYNS